MRRDGIQTLGKLCLIIFVVLWLASLQRAEARDVPLALNLLNPQRDRDAQLRPYLISLRQRIEASWHPLNPERTTTEVYFEVTSTGELNGLKISKSSGHNDIDKSAFLAIETAAPFKRPPQPQGLKIEATFKPEFLPARPLAAPKSSSPPRSNPTPTAQNPPAAPPSSSPYFVPAGTAPFMPQPPSASGGFPAVAPATSMPGQAIPQYIPPPNIGLGRSPSAPPAGRYLPPPPSQSSRSSSLPPEWYTSGREGNHTIRLVASDGQYILLDDGSLWESEDESESSGWSSGDEVFVHSDKLINLSQDAEKVDASCEERGCTLISETHVVGEFEGSDKPIPLDNGMIFEATTYHYHYAYHPEAIVLASRFGGHLMYKLIIGDEIYSAIRLK